MSERQDFTFDATTAPRTAVLTGVMRLESTQAYDRLFQPIRSELETSRERYTVDLSGVLFMNSSGIRALGTLVLAAKKGNVSLRIRGLSSVPWQKKTLASLRLLHTGLELEL
jgi:hypothetical protein